MDSFPWESRLDKKFIKGELKKDPSASRSEWLAEWREDIESAFDPAMVDLAVIPGRGSLPPVDGLRYRAFTDPSGGRGDAWTLAVGHYTREGIMTVDLLKAWRPPFDPVSVTAEVVNFLKSYGLKRVVGDKYGGSWPSASFQRLGITYESCSLPKSQLYLDFMPLLNSRKVELPEDKRLVVELKSLERRRGKSGKDTVDHPPRGHDDRANAVAGLAYLFQKRRGGGIVSGAKLIYQGYGEPSPE
ncbi:MAG: hypothetical protein JRJ66_10605 [Deltaproteobacteria bacterium]|nr:hypothetical protein [Deltaproteobacteria bacterium]MBW2045465.1 hypothetical protein [Deltaproteobacteria bacterium]